MLGRRSQLWQAGVWSPVAQSGIFHGKTKPSTIKGAHEYPVLVLQGTISSNVEVSATDT